MLIKIYSERALTVEHYHSGKRHRAGRPAIEKWADDGRSYTKEYWLNGKLDRSLGPAVVSVGSNGKLLHIAYYKDGEFHRPKHVGPAVIKFAITGEIRKTEYWVDGSMSLESVLKYGGCIGNSSSLCLPVAPCPTTYCGLNRSVRYLHAAPCSTTSRESSCSFSPATYDGFGFKCSMYRSTTSRE